jgi:hypothetical protein
MCNISVSITEEIAMNKYRIVKEMDYYVIQQRVMFFFWSDLRFSNFGRQNFKEFNSFDEALCTVEYMLARESKKRVVVWPLAETGDKDE